MAHLVTCFSSNSNPHCSPGDLLPCFVEAETSLHSLGDNFRKIEIKSCNRSAPRISTSVAAIFFVVDRYLLQRVYGSWQSLRFRYRKIKKKLAEQKLNHFDQKI
jgi:hypothetical protein